MYESKIKSVTIESEEPLYDKQEREINNDIQIELKDGMLLEITHAGHSFMVRPKHLVNATAFLTNNKICIDCKRNCLGGLV